MKYWLIAIILVVSQAAAQHKPHIHGVTVPDWYDSSCCSGEDCYPVGNDEVTELPDGAYRYRTFKFPKSKVLPSRDHRIHVCIYRPPVGLPVARCIYVQQGS